MSVSLVLRPAPCGPIVIAVVLEYRSDSEKLPTFPDLLWDLQGARKISENVETAVNLYEFAESKPGVSTMKLPYPLAVYEIL